jgi:hypothetical protein
MRSIALIGKINTQIMENEPNNKKRAKKTTLKNEDKVTPLDRSQINELLSESIRNYVVRAKKESKDIEEIVSLVTTHVSEFLQAFMILGYDMKGNPICIHHATNQMDADALNSLLNRIIFSNRVNE